MGNVWDKPITADTDWGGDASTNNLPVSGRQVQAWIKGSIKNDTQISQLVTAWFNQNTTKSNTFWKGLPIDTNVLKWENNLLTIIEKEDNNSTNIDEEYLNDFIKNYLTENKYITAEELPFVYDAVKKAWLFEGDFVVTGAISMFSNLTNFTPSTVMDAVQVDGTTIVKNAQGQLTVIGGGGSGGSGGGLTAAEVNLLISNALSPVNENIATKWTQDDTKIANWDAAYDWGDHSAAGYAIKTRKISTGTGLTGGGDLSADRTISLDTVGTAGTYTKVTTDAYGRVKSGTTLAASDIPPLDWSKITSGKPTTISGYGITDAYTKEQINTELAKYILKDTAQDISAQHNFVNGLKIGGLGITKSQDDVIYVDANLVVRGAVTMFGSGATIAPSIWASIPFDETMEWNGSEWSVVGGGSGSVNEATVNNLIYEYLTKNSYAKISDISSALTGYATQSWVEGKKYLTGITSSMVTTALGYTPYNSANFTKSNIKSTLGISDWALAATKPSYTAAEVGALSTSGGTISGNLSLKETNSIILRPSLYTHYSGIGYDTKGDECIAIWAKNAATRLRWYAGIDLVEGVTINSMMGITPDFEISKASGIAEGYIGGYTIIHSNNIGQQSVNYATSAGVADRANDAYRFTTIGTGSNQPDLNTECLGGGLVRNYSGPSYWKNAPAGLSYGMVLTLSSAPTSGLQGQLAWDVNHASTVDTTRNLWWRANDETSFANSKWHQIAFTDSNVASATKLQTARTIFGQFFDGSANISGNIFPIDASGCYYNENGILYHTDKIYQATILRVTSSYDVAIGGTTALDKLHVYGRGRFVMQRKGDKSSIVPDATALTISTNSAGHTGYNTGIGFNALGDYSGLAYKNHIHGWIGLGSATTTSSAECYPLVFATNGSTSVGVSPIERMRITPDGNVAIGGTTASAKLHVHGDILATGAITMFSQLSMKNVIDYDGLSLAQLAQIKPARFSWKDGRDSLVHVGGIADDVMQVLPEVIHRTSDDKLTMDYGSAAFYIGASLIKPVIDHEKRIADLERENKQLKQQLERLRVA